jgi:hypothetical protein
MRLSRVLKDWLTVAQGCLVMSTESPPQDSVESPSTWSPSVNALGQKWPSACFTFQDSEVFTVSHWPVLQLAFPFCPTEEIRKNFIFQRKRRVHFEACRSWLSVYAQSVWDCSCVDTQLQVREWAFFYLLMLFCFKVDLFDGYISTPTCFWLGFVFQIYFQSFQILIFFCSVFPPTTWVF